MTDFPSSPETDSAIDVASMLSRAQEFVDRNAGADREDMARAIIMFFRSELMRRAGRSSEFAQRSPLQAPDGFRVVPVRVLQSAYDRIDAMLANIEPDLRAANSVRIELRHLVNETFSLADTSTTGECQFPKCNCPGSPLDPVCAVSSPERASK